MGETVDVVQRRHRILEALADGPKGKPGLTDATTNARSTVDRGIDELADADLVVREGSEYRLTAAGLRVLEAYREYRTQTTLYADYADALCGLRPDDEFPALLLDGADVETASPEMPTRPVKRGHEGLAEADAIYSAVPVLLAYHSEFWEAAKDETDVELEVIYTSAVLETMEVEYPHWRETMVETGLLTPLVNDDLPSYALAVVEGYGGDPDVTVVNVLVHDEEGDPKTHLSNDSSEAVAWARETFQRLRADAELVC